MKKVGLQLYSIRDVLSPDEATVRDVFGKLAGYGYTQIEPAGIPLEPALFARCAKDAGLEIVNTHYSGQEIFEDTDKALRVHEALGCRYMGIGGYPLRTPEDTLSFIENANRAGSIISKHGFKFVYHNHSHEFIVMENGKTIYDMLLEGLDPAVTTLQLDCYWAQNAGLDPADFLRKHSDRINMIHLKDMGVRYDPETGHAHNFITEVGHGNMNYKGIVAAADEIGCEFFVVEQDANWIDGDPLKAVAASAHHILTTLI